MFIKRKQQSKPLSKQKLQKTYNQGPQDTSLIDLTQLENGKSAKVAEIQGGAQVTDRLEAMEIVPGTIIVKKSASIMRGPIVIEKGNMQLAIGFGTAQKIKVEPVD